MKNHTSLKTIIFVLACLNLCISQQIPDGPYLGQIPPDVEPKIFAPGIISQENSFDRNAAFYIDGKEFYFVRTDADWSFFKIMYTREENGHWTEPALVSFSNVNDNCEPFISPDGQKLYFASNRPPGEPKWNFDLWVTKRTENGWGEPTHLGFQINTGKEEFYPSVTSDGTIYFASSRQGGKGDSDIYRSRLENGQYKTVENLGDSINSKYNDYDPLIAPDESYLIFQSRDRGEWYGHNDLYISYKKADGTWAKPKNLGPKINTDDAESSPVISPDGKYFFFTRKTNDGSDVYWVDSKVIDEFLPDKPDTTSGIEGKRSLPQKFELNQNYPNPFNPTTTIQYSLEKPAQIQLNIYNIQGKKVKTLVNSYKTSGLHSVIWNATDEQGYKVSSGVYFYQISIPELKNGKKMLLLL